ncbi:cell division topological specificity factor MinE [Orenia metallireducens]|uniref:Cell division topological specificity factor n=1 Tax=Orenia metallireducens TaxID=1413210 RepID=A0A285HB13_9FIRM|nr:cell division topological specificity factor MinE [Orenia metallireducens]SNY32930.1 cell division topological specificity factor MinE [Orenia metallireducens]
MLDIMKGIFNNKEDVSSKDVAKERLRLVLVHDRIGVSPEIIEEMKEEMIEVISKYLDIDNDRIDMDLERQDNSVALIANIPVRRLKKKR